MCRSQYFIDWTPAQKMNFGSSSKRKVGKQDPQRRIKQKKKKKKKKKKKNVLWTTRKPEHTTNSIKCRLHKAKFKIETSRVFRNWEGTVSGCNTIPATAYFSCIHYINVSIKGTDKQQSGNFFYNHSRNKQINKRAKGSELMCDFFTALK